MFSNLVESKPKVRHRRGGTILSIVAHYGLALFMIFTSAEASTAGDGPRQEQIDFVEPDRPDVVTPEPAGPELLPAPLPPRRPVVLTLLLHIPEAIPEIDLTQRATDPDDFIRRVRSDAAPTGGDRVETPVKDTYLALELEKPAVLAPNSATPVYPDILRQAGVEGQALVSFVVDTSGRVDPGTIKLIHATHDLFATAVKNALPRMRFVPAELGGRKVRQLVQQPYTFTIGRWN